MNENIVWIPKDLIDICNSYLYDFEMNYFSGQNNWIKIPKCDVFNVAALNGWFDLLSGQKKNIKKVIYIEITI